MAEIITANVDVSSGKFLDDASRFDGVSVIRVTLPRSPDQVRERYSGDPVNPFRAATPTEISAAADSLLTGTATVGSRQKDILSTIAWAIRLKDPAAWNALTLAQKKAAVLAEADNWRDIRIFAEKSL